MESPWDHPLPISSEAKSQIVTVLGAQWGDEGKGKLVDVLAAASDVCCRFNGGSNAGHTLVVEGVHYALHLTPCGVLYSHTMNLLGNGVVIHLKTLFKEFDEIERTIPKASERVLISSRAHLVFDFHQYVDGCQESERIGSGSVIGTTKRGIGPCYSAKMSRTGIRVCDLLNWPVFEKKYRSLCSDYQRRYGFEHNCDEELDRHRQYSEAIRCRIVDGVSWIHTQLRNGKKILIEGANATFLDIDFGTYPFVTSSSTIAGGVCTGLGIPPALICQVLGVVKAYTTRVGEGPFLTELKNAEGEMLRNNGSEFGTTTGRPRRCGWFDAPMVRYSNVICGFVAINLTKVDVLTGFKVVKICVGYRRKTSKELLPDIQMPTSCEEYDQLEPVYEELPGWNEKLDNINTFEDLPITAQNYIKRIESLIHCPIVWIGVGAGRKQMIYKSPLKITN